MKRWIVMVTLAAAMMVGGASNSMAEMVNIGLGQMERSEFQTLKAMVQGQQPDKTVATRPPVRVERYGLVEMSSADFQDLKNKMGRPAVALTDTPSAKSIRMVDIGTGRMPIEEFNALKRMVAGDQLIAWDHLAAIAP